MKAKPAAEESALQVLGRASDNMLPLPNAPQSCAAKGCATIPLALN
jgi:hypothetical protein